MYVCMYVCKSPVHSATKSKVIEYFKTALIYLNTTKCTCIAMYHMVGLLKYNHTEKSMHAQTLTQTHTYVCMHTHTIT